MVYQTKKILTESETNSIRSMYGLSPLRRDYIFEMCTTVDGRYFIVRDEVFDIQEQLNLGNLWGSIDVFKNIFTNVKSEELGEEYNQIKESILTLPLLENRDNLYELRDILLEFNFLDDTWLGRKLKSTGKGITDTVTSGWEGLKEFGVAISKGEWSQILTLLSKGVKWILRRLKEAMYSTIGMIVDAILVATGIGKGAQMVAWGLVLALDIHQFINDDYEGEEKNDSTFFKLLDIGFDMIGFAFAGGFAKLAKVLFKPLRGFGNNIKGAAEYVSKSPKMKEVLQKILSGAQGAPSKLKSVSASIAKKFPKGAQFINGIMGGIGNVISGLVNTVKSLLGVTGRAVKAVTGSGKFGTGARAGLTTTGVLYGFEKLLGGSEDDLGNAIKNNQVKPDFSDVEI